MMSLMSGLRPLLDPGRFGRSLSHLSRPRGRIGEVAQLVEHRTENAGVGGSSPPLAMKKSRRHHAGGSFFCREGVFTQRWFSPCSAADRAHDHPPTEA